MSTTNRITGLATGMDTESIIEQLMEASRAPLDKLEKNETKVEWQREALLDINSKFLSFRTNSLDMKLQGTYKSYSADSTNKGYVTASATSEAQEGTYKVSVSELATKSTITGMQMPQAIKSKNITSSKIQELKGTSFDITYNGETKTISFGADESISNVTQLRTNIQKKLDDAFGANQISVTSNFTTITISSATSLNMPVTLTDNTTGNSSLTALGISSGSSTAFNVDKTLEEFLGPDVFGSEEEMQLTVNGKEFSFKKTDTLSQVFNTLNNDTDVDVTIKYSNVKKCMIMSRDTYGAGRQLEISGDNDIEDAFWSKLKVDYYNYTDTSGGATFESNGGKFEAGKNAVFTITSPDGETAQDVQSASNTFTYNGVSMTFLEADPTKDVAITVSKNVDEIYNKIKGFTDSYNELLVTLNKYYKEDVSKYEPLTEKERETLSETQEEKWETKAKQGILRRDSTLRDAIESMRSAVTSYVSGSKISSLFEIGISTSAYDSVNSENNGKLVIDENKLKEALKNDIDGVASLFTSTPTQIQGAKLENRKLNLDGQSFSVTYGGETRTINLSGQYDLANAEDITDFEDYMKEVFAEEFGENRISVSVISGKILINSLKSVDLTINSSAKGKIDSSKDALKSFGIEDGSKYDTKQRGFATRLYDICTTAMNGIIDKAGSSATTVDASILGQQLKRVKENIQKQKLKLETLEERYYKQFAAMEKAISDMNAQSSSIANMLSSGN